MTYVEKVKRHLGEYKEQQLGIKSSGCWNGVSYSHILPDAGGTKNILINPNCYKINKSLLTLEGHKRDIKLHQGWKHLNSSQILCVSYFYEYINCPQKLNELLKYLGINESAKNGEFEYIVKSGDKSNIDFVINLTNGKKVYFEIKYTESEFGTTSKKTPDETYCEIFKKHHSDIKISFENYKKHYQLVRNASLAGNGNYTVFLIPQKNETLISQLSDFELCVDNYNQIKSNLRIVYWEDLLKNFPNNEIYKKYFDLK